jgi:hypothetical protein
MKKKGKDLTRRKMYNDESEDFQDVGVLNFVEGEQISGIKELIIKFGMK